jgi:hypothetical protein
VQSRNAGPRCIVRSSTRYQSTTCVALLLTTSRITILATTLVQAQHLLDLTGILLISDQEPAQQIFSSHCYCFQHRSISRRVKAPILCLGTTAEPSGAVARYKPQTSDEMLERILECSDQSQQYISKISILLVRFRPPIAALNTQAVSLSELTLAHAYNITARYLDTNSICHFSCENINHECIRKNDG